VNVTEFISTHENDLSLPSLGHGISAQFMFSPDPEVSGHGQVKIILKQKIHHSTTTFIPSGCISGA
jgi:hypothetical protein